MMQVRAAGAAVASFAILGAVGYVGTGMAEQTRLEGAAHDPSANRTVAHLMYGSIGTLAALDGVGKIGSGTLGGLYAPLAIGGGVGLLAGTLASSLRRD